MMLDIFNKYNGVIIWSFHPMNVLSMDLDHIVFFLDILINNSLIWFKCTYLEVRSFDVVLSVLATFKCFLL